MSKVLLGVVHLPPLLSSARGSGAFEAILAHALRDAQALRDGGADGAIVENFGDAPFHKGTRDDPVPPDVPAALAVVAREVRVRTGLPVGINCLRNDGVAALAAAAVAGASWVRVNVLTGAYVTDQGVIEGEAARLSAYRRRLGAAVAIVADLFVKHAAPLGAIPPEVAALDLAQRSGAEALVLSGDRTGLPVDAALLRRTKAAVGAFPVWLGSGLSAQNANELWPLCDGAIVGTAIKRDGIVTEPVDAERVAALRKLLRG
jgi:membrane complex biogenesis BtpA family protein